MWHLRATINRGLIYLVFRCPSAFPHAKRRNLDTGSGLRHEASPANQCACFYLLRKIEWKDPLFFLYFTRHLSSYRYHLYPLSYGYHMYPPNPKKKNVASLYEVLYTSELLVACTVWITKFCLHTSWPVDPVWSNAAARYAPITLRPVPHHTYLFGMVREWLARKNFFASLSSHEQIR